MSQKLSKFIVSQDLFHKLGKVFACPICGQPLMLPQNSLVCPNKHAFDLSRKGYVRLLKKERALNDNFYDFSLFSHRRSFILAGFYELLHNKITEILKEQSAKLILDLGCGEGSHLQPILRNLDNCLCIGCDLAPDGIQMATDYLDNNYLPIVADTHHLPFKEEAFDAVIDILSPFIYREVLRVLKHNGVFIKVSPTFSYLKELRSLYGLNDYEKEEDVFENLKKHFSHIRKETIERKYPLTQQNYEDLIHMTPLMHYEQSKSLSAIECITISLNIYIIRKEEQ